MIFEKNEKTDSTISLLRRSSLEYMLDLCTNISIY